MDFFDMSVSLVGTGLNTENKWALLAACALAVLLEWFLARREAWWPGLIPPVLALLWAAGLVLMGCGIAPDFWESMAIRPWMLIKLFLKNCIPALALLAVCAVCRALRRRKRRRARELDSMRVDDL